MNITEKASYVKGILQGMELDKDKKEVKIIEHIVNLLNDIAVDIEDLKEQYDEILDQVHEIDEDLSDLEEEFYEGEDGLNDEVFYEVTCPVCNETVCIDEGVLLDGEIKCPNCTEVLEFDFDSLDDCSCGEECNCGDKDTSNDK